MATVRDFQVNNGLEVNLNANVANAIIASDYIQSNPERPIAPTVVFDFTKGQLDSRVTFIRASSATYTAANGTIVTVANNIPRFQYESGQNQGLWIETQRTNLYKYSSDIFSATTGSIVAGSYVFWDTNPSVGIRQTTLGTVANQDYAGSFYVKVNVQSNQILQLLLGDATLATINANTATVGQWTRVSGIGRQGGSGDICDLRVFSPKIGIQNTTIWSGGANTGFMTQNYGIAPNGARESTRVAWTSTDNTLFDIEIWGFQVEAGSYVTSYIPTGAISATRMHDLAYVYEANTVLKMNPNQGSFLFVGKTYKGHNANTPSYDQGTAALTLQNKDFGLQYNYYNIIVRDEAVNQMVAAHISYGLPGAPSQSNYVATGGQNNFWYTNTEIRAVGCYTNNTFYVAGSSNGVANVTVSQPLFTTGIGMPTTYLIFGQNYGQGNRMFGGPIKKVAYYNRALSNNEIISLTTL